MVVDIKSKEISFVPIDSVKPNPKNRNKHTDQQIDALVKIIEYQGFRHPLVVSKRSGFLVSGHGRLMAARKMGSETLPVVFQDFDSEEQEYAAGVSDNAIASWAEIDLPAIHSDLPELAPFDLDLLGVNNFKLEPDPIEPSIDDFSDEEETMKFITCPHCDKEFEASQGSYRKA